MKNVKNKLVGASIAASSLMMASFAQAAFTVSIASTGSSGGFTYYNIAAVNNGNTLGNNTGTALDLIDSTITTVGAGTTGAIKVQLADEDGDGANDANVIGNGLNATSYLGTYERFGSVSAFSVAFVGDSSTQVASSTATNYTTDPGGTGSPTQSIDAAYTNGTVHSLEVAGTGSLADTSAVTFAHVVVPTGTVGTVSGQLGGNIGTVYNFTIAFPTASSTQNIISLTSSVAGAPTTYGASVGSLTVNAVGGNSTGGYIVAKEAVSPATQTGYAPVTFTPTPTSGVEVYALKLSSATADSTLVADINAQSATDGVTASLVAGSAFSGEFPGYDILLTASAANALNPSSYLAFDFSQDTNAAGITVTNVAAVPEPATVAGLVVGTVGLLLGRRKNRAA